jgi:hypothetical protein
MNQPQDLNRLQVVVAGNYAQFCDWRFEHNLSPNSKKILYVRDISVLHGIQGPIEVHRIGTWNMRKDLDEVLTMIRIIEASCERT